MITQKEFDLISECYAYADKKAHEASKRYTDKRLSEEKAALVRRLDALEAAAAPQKGHNA